MNGKLESNQASNNNIIYINDKKCQYFSKDKVLYSSELITITKHHLTKNKERQKMEYIRGLNHGRTRLAAQGFS